MDGKILKTSAEKWKLQIIKWKHRTRDDKPESFKTDVLNREKEMAGERGANFKRENYHDARDLREHGRGLRVSEMTAGCLHWSCRRWQEEGMKLPLVMERNGGKDKTMEGGKERGRENVSLKTDYLCRFCNH